MSKYIEVDALIKALRLEYPMMPMFKENRKEWEVKTEGYRNAEKIISNAPTIDVVHCRECRMADWYTAIDGSRYCYCMITGASPRTDNDFCSFGEREDE